MKPVRQYLLGGLAVLGLALSSAACDQQTSPEPAPSNPPTPVTVGKFNLQLEGTGWKISKAGGTASISNGNAVAIVADLKTFFGAKNFGGPNGKATDAGPSVVAFFRSEGYKPKPNTWLNQTNGSSHQRLDVDKQLTAPGDIVRVYTLQTGKIPVKILVIARNPSGDPNKGVITPDQILMASITVSVAGSTINPLDRESTLAVALLQGVKDGLHKPN
jgi:hypothetical protein